jgi:hypothetical protein
MPNMNMQIAPTIRPVRMFFLARRRFIVDAKNTVRCEQSVGSGPASAGARTYRCTSATIAQNSSAR